MARWCTETIIADVDFSGCRVVIIDPQHTFSNYAGSLGPPSRGGSFHPQRTNTGRYKGRKWGAQFEAGAEAEVLLEALENIRAAEAAQTPFRVRQVDGLVVIDAIVWPDYDMGEDWFTRGPESDGMVDNVAFHFGGVGPYIAP